MGSKTSSLNADCDKSKGPCRTIITHQNIECNMCSMKPIHGPCYKCVECSSEEVGEDDDSIHLCTICYHRNYHNHHHFELVEPFMVHIGKCNGTHCAPPTPALPNTIDDAIDYSY